ncbi:MAG: hypothetical protein QMD44_03240 [Thermodesulfovibrionales bacterium]|jgi:hypothetical protein|nr:hypothetical protein [Thermodesulfovibrionales bacterium]
MLLNNIKQHIHEITSEVLDILTALKNGRELQPSAIEEGITTILKKQSMIDRQINADAQNRLQKFSIRRSLQRLKPICDAFVQHKIQTSKRPDKIVILRQALIGLGLQAGMKATDLAEVFEIDGGYLSRQKTEFEQFVESADATMPALFVEINEDIAERKKDITSVMEIIQNEENKVTDAVKFINEQVSIEDDKGNEKNKDELKAEISQLLQPTISISESPADQLSGINNDNSKALTRKLMRDAKQAAPDFLKKLPDASVAELKHMGFFHENSIKQNSKTGGKI